MINKQQQIYNWLTTGIQQPSHRLEEMFYYDKASKEFFSIMVVDYFLFDENFEIANDVTSSYSIETVENLAGKIRRIESGSSEIIAVPRLGFGGLANESEHVLTEIDSFLNLNAINIDDAMIWLPEESGSITISLNEPKDVEKRRSWWKFW